MKYAVVFEFDDDECNDDLLDGFFATREEAEAAALETMGNYRVGVETLMMGGHDYPTAKIIGYYIEEYDDDEGEIID